MVEYWLTDTRCAHASLTCIGFWPCWRLRCLWSSCAVRTHNWPLSRILNELQRPIKHHFIRMNSRAPSTEHRRAPSTTVLGETHLCVGDCWQRSTAAAPRPLLAGPCKRREGGGSEGGGGQHISVTFGEGGDLWPIWWLLISETEMLNIHLRVSEGSTLFDG